MYKNLTLLCCMSVFALSNGVFAQANDLCADAEALVLGAAAVAGDNTLATATADALGTSTGAPEVWYSFVGTGNTVNVETFAGSMTDSQIAIWDACGGASVASDDDGGTGAMSLIANFCTVSGTTYFVEVQGWNGQEGSFTISAIDNGADLYCSDALASNYVEFPVACQVEDNATCLFVTPGCQDAAAVNFNVLADADCAAVVGGADTSCCVYPPANDTCANAEALTIDGALVTGDNTNASDENDADEANNWGSDGTEGDVWFSFVGNGGLVDIETFDTPPGGNNDTQIAVYAACGSDPSLASDDDNASTGGAFMSEITGFCAEAATTYLVEVEGWNGTVGAFNIAVRTSAVLLVDICDDVLASNYTDPLTVSACVSVDNLLCVFGVAGCADASALNYDATADSCDGMIGGVDTSCCEYPPANDDCSGAVPVICGDVVSGSSLNSTIGNEVLALECGTAIEGAGVWYSFASNGSEEVTFSTCGSALDTKINVYSGSCGAYVCAGGNDDDCGVQSNVTVITSAAPTDYFIHVSGWNGNVGDFDLAVTCDVAGCVPPVNDVCDSSFPIPDGIAFIDDNVCAQANDLNPACSGFGFVDGVWYTWNSGANNALAIEFGPAAAPSVGDSAAVNPSLAMFSGNCANPTELNCFNGAVTENVTGLTINTTYYFLVFTDDDVDQGQFDLILTGGLAGCITVGACNYDASASIDDGSCDLSCLGCTNPLALNYDSAALADDGSCVVPSCDPIVSTEASICYEVSTDETYNFTENTLGEGVSIAFNAGTVEAGWDQIYVYDDLGTQLNVQFDGDLTGLIFTSAGSMSINIISDASVSCGSGSQTEISLTVYCGALEVVGCSDPLATNYDPSANAGDQAALCQYLGCTDVLACNYNDLAITDDGTCCLTNCITVEISDSFGDGGTSVTIFDDLGNTVASLTGTLFGNTETFCIADVCADVVVSVDNFPGEAGVTITDASNGVLLDFGAGTITAGSTTTVTVGAAVGCVVSGCTDATALNYNAAANADCLDVFGGADVTCCIYPVANNDCDGAIALVAGVETAWDSNNTDDSGNNCSPTLTNDVWYSYTPACDLEVTITSSSNQGGEVAIWEGDCAALTLVECGPNEGFIGTTITAVLTGGTTYSIQVGSNSDFSPVSTGTVILEEGLCRGCTYEDSPDYSAAAGIDDGSCTFEDCSCPGDFTGDGFVNVSDLGGFLGAFGEACE